MTALLSCSVSPALVFLDPYGIDCCTMKHVCFGICIICCSRYAHLPWAGCTGSSVGKQSTGWTDLFSFTYLTPVRAVSCTCHLVFTLAQSTTWRQIDCMWANVSGDYEPKCLETLLPSSICLLTNQFTLFQHERDESP